MHKTQTLNDFIFKHCSQSMDNALSAERYPLWKRLCPELKDILRNVELVEQAAPRYPVVAWH